MWRPGIRPGSSTPKGICGSGIIDLLAEMRRNGWIDMAGNLEPTASSYIVFLPQEHVVVYARSLAESIYCVQFASIPDFLIRMHAAKFIPHTDLKSFPSVGG